MLFRSSLRERYKQADLEAIALKYVHRKSKCYLLTLETHEIISLKEKIKKGDVIGLDDAILCSNHEIDDLIKEFKQYSLELAGNIDIISTNQLITEEIILSNK